MARQVHRPSDAEYWIAAWSRVLFAGDVFEAIPFGDQPTTLLTDDDADPTKHYLGEIAFGYGLLTSPTCDMYDQFVALDRLSREFESSSGIPSGAVAGPIKRSCLPTRGTIPFPRATLRPRLPRPRTSS
ncbi:MAG: hypothetical protein GEU88_10450 [Solirubrobacterales bacterium]|nr:hypothetical protein [Solirubrobacterales bacterium]